MILNEPAIARLRERRECHEFWKPAETVPARLAPLDLLMRRAITPLMIKVTPTKMGPQLEVELHDKVGVLRVLAKASGLLEPEQDVDRPSVVQINMSGPEEPKIVEAENVEVNEPQGSGTDPSSNAQEQVE